MAEATFGVLGPVEVRVSGGPAVRLPPSVRALLARLALAPGRVVSVEQLVDALWGEDLPADAANALQIRVSKLRRALAGAGADGEVLVTRAPGYRLAVAADSVDAHRFEQLAGRARTQAAADETAASVASYEQALALWRGPALADAGDTEWARAERTRLEELRLGAVEDRLELLLRLGRHHEAVADLERLVAAHPLRERPHRLLMLALYRAGRQADALDVHRALRDRLLEDLGIDPSPDLQALAEAILRQQVPPAGRHPAAQGGPRPPSGAVTPAPGAGASAAPAPGPGRPAARPAEAAGGGADAARHDVALPRRLSSLVGRQDDIATVLHHLRQASLVTLTGPGGVGKTTLALEAARRADAELAARVHLVRLAALPPGADVTAHFAAELGATGETDAISAEAIAEHLAGARTVLVVDNCEHVVDSAAALVERLIQSCPDLRVLATSREALAVPGELQIAVSPLAVPDEAADPQTIAEAAAVRLFLDRARAVNPSFTMDDATAAVVGSICRELDGMPLAIELAAARVKALPPAQIAARLRDRFSLLTGGPRTSEARHRTLRAVLDWSHELLTGPERGLLRRLAVFRGGWTLPAAEAVCGFADIGPEEVADLLFRLIDRSLVVPDPAAGRFRLLATVHQYAAARLAEAGETDAVLRRHLDHYTRLAEEHSPRVRFDGDAWTLLKEEHDNLRAAMDHALQGAEDDPGPALRLACALIGFWNYGARHEGVRALTALVDAGKGTTAARALALQGIGLLHVYYPTPRSRAAARESLALFEELGDDKNAAVSRLVIAWEGQYRGDAERQHAMIEHSRAVLGDDDRGWWRAITHYVEALLYLRLGRFAESAAQWRRCHDLMLAAGDHFMGGAILAHLGVALRQTGRREEALAVLEESVEDARARWSPHGLAFALVHLAHTRLDLHETEAAIPLLAEAVEVARSVRNPRCQAWAAWGRARIAMAGGRPETAADECRTALKLLEDREFPWARAQLWTLMAETAEATGRPDEAEHARTMAAAAR
ncbi:hypothetical protein Acsp04_51240 [Actinomadura sp. NBRC 104425]|uniref:BTAD domain-containing putative transcriptional regulator n=1 Tax=Actinomadura sp. NBRC 104425 TaxID=3032204 RepID=UPI0024A02C78|nr:BTAD domain-containing putative transcriptional regulator [Actinomadura sp. NBRC 104425]GLZ14889.1 hypothetical protein Acsp04_51240 [Actinomadura sp. NBRC 104425]